MRPAEPIDDEYDEYEDDDVASDPWGETASWEDVNPYAAPVKKSPARRGGRSGRGSTAGLETIGLGLLIQGWSIAAIILTLAGLLFFVLVGAGLAAGGGNAGNGMFGLVLGGAGGIALILASLGVLAGEFFCLATPERTGARGLIIATVACLSLQLAINIITGVFEADLGRSIVIMLSLVSAAAGLTHFVTYLLFQRTIADYIRREDLAQQARVILTGMGTCLALTLIVSILANLPVGPALRALASLVMLPVGIGVIVFAVMQLFLLFRLGSALRS